MRQFKEGDRYDIPVLGQKLGELGYDLTFFDQTTSTMDEAAKLGIKPTIVLADNQTNGRGRAGRSWFDQKGMSVLFTIIEPFNEIDGDPKGSSFEPQQMFALAISIALQKLTQNPDIRVKWPNDLVYTGDDQTSYGRKIGGVLIENPDYLHNQTYPKLFGSGTNVFWHPAEGETDYGAISLSEIARCESLSRQDVLLAIMQEWSITRPHLRDLSNPIIYQRYDNLWRENANVLKDKRIRIVGVNRTKDETIEGQVLETPLGKALILATEQGVIEFMEFNPNTKVEIIQ